MEEKEKYALLEKREKEKQVSTYTKREPSVSLIKVLPSSKAPKINSNQGNF